MKRLVTFRASDLIIKQIEDLKKFSGMSKTELFSIAINSLYVSYFLVGDIFEPIMKSIITKKNKEEGFSKEDKKAIMDYFEYRQYLLRLMDYGRGDLEKYESFSRSRWDNVKDYIK